MNNNETDPSLNLNLSLLNPDINLAITPMAAENAWNMHILDLKPTQDITDTLSNDKELLRKVLGRYNKLLSLFHQELGKLGMLIDAIKYSDEEKNELFWIAIEIETKGVELYRRIEQITSNLPHDVQIRNQVESMKKNELIEALHKIILHRALSRKKEKVAEHSQRKKTETLKNPKYPSWKQWGEKWVQAVSQEKNDVDGAMKSKQQTMVEIAQNYPGIISNHFSAKKHNQDYYYFFLSVHDVRENSRLNSLVNGVNEAQESLLGQVSAAGMDNVLRAPTTDLRKVFADLNKVSREIKIHLMPDTQDQPMVLDRILELISQNPTLKDKIQAIKVREVGNNSPDNLPEFVIYTTDESLTELLKILMEEFSDLVGTGRVPRFNDEVLNKLIYVAQSGGDLKNSLDQMGVLDKFFDKNANYAKLRI